MIKIRRGFGFAIALGTHEEITRLIALSGTELKPGDKLTVLPAKHHVHRNPRRKPLLRYLEDKGDEIDLKTDGGPDEK